MDNAVITALVQRRSVRGYITLRSFHPNGKLEVEKTIKP